MVRRAGPVADFAAPADLRRLEDWLSRSGSSSDRRMPARPARCSARRARQCRSGWQAWCRPDRRRRVRAARCLSAPSLSMETVSLSLLRPIGSRWKGTRPPTPRCWCCALGPRGAAPSVSPSAISTSPSSLARCALQRSGWHGCGGSISVHMIRRVGRSSMARGCSNSRRPTTGRKSMAGSKNDAPGTCCARSFAIAESLFKPDRSLRRQSRAKRGPSA